MTMMSKSCFRQNTCLTKLPISCSLTWWIQVLSSTSPVFKYFPGLEFRRKKFRYFQGCVGTLSHIHCKLERSRNKSRVDIKFLQLPFGPLIRSEWTLTTWLKEIATISWHSTNHMQRVNHSLATSKELVEDLAK